jgi:hypothetical protein
VTRSLSHTPAVRRLLLPVLLGLWACEPTKPDGDSGSGLGAGDEDDDDTGEVDCDDTGEDDGCAPEDMVTYFLDADGDGYGDDDTPIEACEQPGYAAAVGGDCDDLDAAISPDGEERCNGLDDDCNGTIDDDAVDAPTWYTDADGDGFGDPASTVEDCAQPSDAVEDDTDCDDTDPTVHPGSTTLDDPATGFDADCDGTAACADANCDGEVDLFLSVYWTQSGGYCGDDLMYDGDGSDFSAVTPTTLTSTCAWQHDTADLNQDGYPDLVTVITTDDVMPRETQSHVYWGSPTGWSDGDRTDIPTTGPVRVLIEDLNQDGWHDLVFSEASSRGNAGFEQQSTVHWGSAAGFSTSTDLTTFGAWEAAAADLDADGHTDLVFCNFYDDGLTDRRYEVPSFIFWGSSGGYSDTDRSDLPTAGCRGVEIDDLDQDGLPDIVFANSIDNVGDWQIDSMVYWNSATGFSDTNTTSLPTSWSHGLTHGDFNGDGWQDLAFGSFYGDFGYDHPSYIYWNDGGTFDADDVTELDGHASYWVEAADLDGDGADELIVPSNWSDDDGGDTLSRVYWGGTHGICGSQELPTDAPGMVSIGDLNSDGYPELAFPGAYGGGSNMIYWGTASGYSEADSSEIGDGWGTWAPPLMIGETGW